MDVISHDLESLQGVGKVNAAHLEKLGLRTMRDLLRYYPHHYEDRRDAFAAIVVSQPIQARDRRGRLMTNLTVSDGLRKIYVTFFSVTYVKDDLKLGEEYSFFGRVEEKNGRYMMTHPIYERIDRRGRVTGRLMPVYRKTAGLKQHTLRLAVGQAAERLADHEPDLLPQSVRASYNLCHLGYALREIHAPANDETLEIARCRLAFEELFLLSLCLASMREKKADVRTDAYPATDFSPLTSQLPFELTNAQRRVIAEISADLTCGRVMNRLLLGDVGSGKTLVAAAAAFAAINAGRQVAFMAPTELLARQHYHTLSALFPKVGLLTGKLTAKEKRLARENIETGGTDLVIGTHALFSESVTFPRLGLIITDEQHRFGVAQRAKLAEKAADTPHTLFMSATPIPRTLALMIYGELDVSLLDELPPGRLPVKTFVVDETYRRRLDAFIAKQVQSGGQVYVVCPLIENLDDEGAATVEGLNEAVAVAERLTRVLSPITVGLVHGKMGVRERVGVMDRFKAGEISVLVATTVIEVGVDVPNAGLMIVENADRFGLSQLHQLRGRVGRGTKESFCVLINGSDQATERLKTLSRTNDGFAIAQADLELRGPGEFFGTAQHGTPALKSSQLGFSYELFSEAQRAAEDLLARSPGLSSPELSDLREYVASFTQTIQN